MFTQNVLVLCLSTYNFQNDKDENVKGTTVYYVDLKNDGSNSSLLGLKPAKGTLPEEQFLIHKNDKFPCYASMQFDMNFANQKIKPVSFDFIKSFEVGELNATAK